MPDSASDALMQLPAQSGPVIDCPLRRAQVDCVQLARAQAMAAMADHTYGRNTPLPAGYREVTAEERADLRIAARPGIDDPLNPKNSDFHAEVFARDEPEPGEYVVAFRGTQSLQDWKNNLQQGVGLKSDEYDRAVKLAKRMNQYSDRPVVFTGHSLGGGLASAAAVVTDKPATTFNAAGLNAATTDGYPANPPPVDAYYVPGELLSAIQDNRAAVLTLLTVATTAASPAAGGALTGWLAAKEFAGLPVLPQALGTRHALPVSPPAGKTALQKINPIDKHGMDWVTESLKTKRKQLGCP